jgi:hypothetical protein
MERISTLKVIFASFLLTWALFRRNTDGFPLRLAARQGHKEIVMILLENGANVNLQCELDPLLFVDATMARVTLLQTHCMELERVITTK